MFRKSGRTFAFLALAIFTWVSFGSTESVADKEPEASITTQEFVENYDGYANKVVDVDGTITSIGFTDTGIVVVLDGNVSCYFKGKEANAFLKTDMAVGDYTSIKGRGNEHNSISLNCEINYCTIR